jgi:hypothetical protein
MTDAAGLMRWPPVRGRHHRIRERPGRQPVAHWRNSLRGAERAWRVGGPGPHRREAFFVDCAAKSGVMPAPHKVIASRRRRRRHPDDLLPGILKTVRMGYDGKGQVRVRTREDVRAAFESMGR